MGYFVLLNIDPIIPFSTDYSIFLTYFGTGTIADPKIGVTILQNVHYMVTFHKS